MNKTYILFSVLFTLLLNSCEKDVGLKDFEFGVEKSYKINGKYQSNDRSLKFTISDINDSRCPIDVECIWAGMVSVKINIEKPLSGTIELNSVFNPVDTLGNYSFELLSVTPYPISTDTIKLEDYDVKLKIEDL